MSKQEDFTIDVVIEIPKGSRNKYEYDHEKNIIRYDRMLYSPMQYPCDYGFIPDTLALDDDPLDVLVLLSEPTFPGCWIEVKPVGVLNMTDDKGEDQKVLAVPVSDPIWNKVNSLDEVNPHLLDEIQHFFQVYKDLEKKTVQIEGWENREAALKNIQECLERYKQEGGH